MDLLDSYQGLGHNLYFDNFYTSPVLLSGSLSEGILACRTVQVNRQGLPKGLKSEVLVRGEVHFMNLGWLTLGHWKDKRDVFCLSTVHGNHMEQCPVLISSYKYMGRVVLMDQMLAVFCRS